MAGTTCIIGLLQLLHNDRTSGHLIPSLRPPDSGVLAALHWPAEAVHSRHGGTRVQDPAHGFMLALPLTPPSPSFSPSSLLPNFVLFSPLLLPVSLVLPLLILIFLLPPVYKLFHKCDHSSRWLVLFASSTIPALLPSFSTRQMLPQH